MTLTGLHILMTYRCTMACDHCFVWSDPERTSTMTLRQLRRCLREARDLGTVNSIYFEGGEPFLTYPILIKGVVEAQAAGFDVGIVTNAFWATSVEDAIQWLLPLEGRVDDLSLSADQYHWNDDGADTISNATDAAEQLGIPVAIISIAAPEVENAAHVTGQLPAGESRLMYRGRAASQLASRARQTDFHLLDVCPYEDLRNPERVHVDPLGYIHLCQGIALGNLFEDKLTDILQRFDPVDHPIVAPLLEGGPALLTERYGIEHTGKYADACHLCCETRARLRRRYPEILAPDQMYGQA